MTNRRHELASISSEVVYAIGEAARLSDRLRALRQLADEHGDAALHSIVAAADDAMLEWQRRGRHAECCQHELAVAVDSAADAQRRLEALLLMSGEIAKSHSPPPHQRWSGLKRLLRAGSRAPRRDGPSINTALGTHPGAGHTVTTHAEDDPRGRAEDVQRERRDVPTQPEPEVDISLRLFGAFRLRCGGRAVDAHGGGKSVRVLKYLLAHHKEAARKDVLIELFWPEADLDTVRRNLHQAIYTVRRMLRDGGPEIDYILFANDAYLVNPALSFWCDVDVFESAIVAGRAAEAGGRRTEALGAYAQAEALYEGAFLADAVYEQWSTSERERLRLRYLEVANRLANLHLDAGDIESAADVSRHVLQQEACDEDSHRRLIRCYGALGRRNLVIQQYRTYVKSNEDAYGLGPSAETTAVFQSVITNQTV